MGKTRDMNEVLREGFGRAPEKRGEKRETEKRPSQMDEAELVSEFTVTYDRLGELLGELERRVEVDPAEEEDTEDRPPA